jgi:hypothetical protein
MGRLLQVLWCGIFHFFLIFSVPVFVGGMLGEALGLALDSRLVPMVLCLCGWWWLLFRPRAGQESKSKSLYDAFVKKFVGLQD